MLTASGSPCNWPGIVSLSRPEWTEASYKGLLRRNAKIFETIPAAKRAETSQAAYNKFRPTEAPKKNTVQPIELPVGYTMCSRFPVLWAVSHVRVGFGDTAVSDSLVHKVGLWWYLHFGHSWGPSVEWVDKYVFNHPRESLSHNSV